MTLPKNSPFTPTDEAIAVGQQAIEGMNRPRPIPSNNIPVQRIRDRIQVALNLIEHFPEEAVEALHEALDLLR